VKLTELEPQFLRFGAGTYAHADAIADADGIVFLCPKCFAANGGSIGTHSIICWQPGRVPDDARPGPGRWNFLGTGLDDLTLRAGSSSILLEGGCNWHGYIENGETRDA
jgi:hypothetical protein